MKRNLLFIAMALAAFGQARAVCFVDVKAAGANDGTTWSDAYVDLQSAVKSAVCSEVWVAKGVYRPTDTNDTSISFNLTGNQGVYGGFTGVETSRDQRNFSKNLTILSGDIGGDDENAGSTNVDVNADDIIGENSIHVVTITPTSGSDSVTLDGFLITGGKANPEDSDDFDLHAGGGLHCAGAFGAGSPKLANLVFKGNYGTWGGGAYLSVANPDSEKFSITNSQFSGNSAWSGGAVYNLWFAAGTSSDPDFVDVLFANNTAENSAGAVFSAGGAESFDSQRFERVKFVGNESAMGGAVLLEDSSDDSDTGSRPIFSDVEFISNKTHLNIPWRTNGDGGAVLIYGVAKINPIFANTTFRDNSAAHDGGAISTSNGNLTLINATFVGNRSANFGGAVSLYAYDNVTVVSALLNVTSADNQSSGSGDSTSMAPFYAGNDHSEGVVNEVNISNTIAWDRSNPAIPEIFGEGAIISIDHGVFFGGCPSGSACSQVSASDPMLGQLGYFGGVSQIMKPGFSGSAIDTGDDGNCPAIDQRGVERPQGKHCDIGSVEFTLADDVIFANGFDD